MQCHKCGSPASSTARFCPRCGAELVQKQAVPAPAGARSRVCPNCGHVVAVTARFCAACGKSMADPSSRTPVRDHGRRRRDLLEEAGQLGNAVIDVSAKLIHRARERLEESATENASDGTRIASGPKRASIPTGTEWSRIARYASLAAVICFLVLPQVGCGNQILNGMDIMHGNEYVGGSVVFCAWVIVIVGIVGVLSGSREVHALVGIVGVLAVLYAMHLFKQGDDINVIEVKYGAWLTALAFIITLSHAFERRRAYYDDR